MRRAIFGRRATFALGALIALGGCAQAGHEDDGEGAEQTDDAQSGVLPDVVVTVEANPGGGGVLLRMGPSRWAPVGDRVRELEVGRRYKVSLETTTEPPAPGGFEVRRLVDFRRVTRLIGTLADDAQDASEMHLLSVHGKSYALYGDTVGGYKEVRASLPKHDYAKTLFAVNAVEDLGALAGRWQWLDYTPVPKYACTQSDAPGTHLDLVDVKPDASVVDGFVTMPLGVREVRYGAHAECTRDGGGKYACAFDSVGVPWGTATFAPGAGGVRFDVVVTREDEGKTRLVFDCGTITAESRAAESED